MLSLLIPQFIYHIPSLCLSAFVAELLPERIKLNTTTFFVGLGIAFYVITCLAIFDIAKKDFGKLAYKFIWGMIAVIPFIGCIIYFVFGFRKGKRIEKYSNL